MTEVAMGGISWVELAGLALAAAMVAVPSWRICSKAGFPGALGLLSVVPVANLGLLYFLAFARWRDGERGPAGR